jgi:hypothetical protein
LIAQNIFGFLTEQSFDITSLPNAFSLKTCWQCHVTQAIAKRERGHRMKMLVEYLENAIKFEQMAAEEKDAKLKAQFEKQAFAYRKLAEKRAKDFGLKAPRAGSSTLISE